MAVLTAPELVRIRQMCAAKFATIGYLKAQINAASQAIEDAMTTRLVVAGDNGKTWPQVVSGVVDAASAPFVFTMAQKKVLFALWADLKFQKDQ